MRKLKETEKKKLEKVFSKFETEREKTLEKVLSQFETERENRKTLEKTLERLLKIANTDRLSLSAIHASLFFFIVSDCLREFDSETFQTMLEKAETLTVKSIQESKSLYTCKQ